MEVSRVVHLAASAGDLPTLQGMIREAPALLEVRNQHGWTPLMAAAKAGRQGAVELLLDDGAAIDARDTATSETALYKAASEGYWRVVELLLERGADCYLSDLSGCRPLHEASRKGYVRVTRCLLEHEQDRHRRGLSQGAVEVDNSGRSAVWWASCWGNAAVLQLLLMRSGHGSTGDMHRPDCHHVTPTQVIQRRPLRRRDLCATLLQEADRHYQLWKARVLVEREAALAHVLLPAAALSPPPHPTVRVMPLGPLPHSQSQSQAGGDAVAACATVAAGASAQEGEGEGEGRETSKAVLVHVLVHVLGGLNCDLFQELIDTIGRTLPMPLLEDRGKTRAGSQRTRRAPMAIASAAGSK